MELKGKIIKVLEIQSGVSKVKGNPWKLQTYILETQEQRPRTVAFDVFGEDKIRNMNIKMGDSLTVYFDIDAREYQGRWYNQVRTWKVERQADETIDGVQHVKYQVPSAPQQFTSEPATLQMDPLPFDKNEELDFPF